MAAMGLRRGKQQNEGAFDEATSVSCFGERFYDQRFLHFSFVGGRILEVGR